MSSHRVPDATDAEAVAWAFDTLRATTAPTTQPVKTVCRCGHVTTTHPGWATSLVVPPVVTLPNELGMFAIETSPVARHCRGCDHRIAPGVPSVVHRLGGGAGVFNRYHNECVDLT